MLATIDPLYILCIYVMCQYMCKVFFCSEELEDRIIVFLFTRWNGGGTPLRQNTEFMYVTSEYSSIRLVA